MPIKLKHIFEKEYGKKKGDRIFYAWENKHKININQIKPAKFPAMKKSYPLKKVKLYR